MLFHWTSGFYMPWSQYFSYINLILVINHKLDNILPLVVKALLAGCDLCSLSMFCPVLSSDDAPEL